MPAGTNARLAFQAYHLWDRKDSGAKLDRRRFSGANHHFVLAVAVAINTTPLFTRRCANVPSKDPVRLLPKPTLNLRPLSSLPLAGDRSVRSAPGQAAQRFGPWCMICSFVGLMVQRLESPAPPQESGRQRLINNL